MAILKEEGTISDDAEENGIIPVENVPSKVNVVHPKMGSLVAVDDLGPRADVSDGRFGAHMVCHGGEGPIDEERHTKSSDETKNADDDKCLVYPILLTRRTSFDGLKTIVEGTREGKTGHELTGKDGPGHDLTPTPGDKSPVESLVEEKDVASY